MIDERRVALAKMTSPEAAEALAGAEVALIPVGATEQHLLAGGELHALQVPTHLSR